MTKSGKTVYMFREASRILDAGIPTIYMATMDGFYPIHNKEELANYYGVDYSEQEDITVIKHTVACCRCGKNNVVKLDRGDDIVYLDDILQGDGWTKDKYGRWFCDDCSYKGGDD